MPSPVNIGSFGDVLDPRFFEITDGEYSLEVDFIPKLYTVKTGSQYTERGSSLTPMGLFTEFLGLVPYDGPTLGYDWQTTHKEYARGIQVERSLVEFDQFDIIESRFRLLARSATQSRQVEAAKTFSEGFSIDSGYTHTENVALFSDSHTSPVSGVSTTTGFDNLTTSAFSPTALKSAYIQFRKFRDNAGQPIEGHEASMLLLPVDLKDRAEEIFGTMKGLDSSDMNKNVLERRYKVVDWIRQTDVNNWFLIDEKLMKENLFWFDKVKPEFARVEDFDTIIAKYRGYYMSTRGRADWRWGLGGNVS